MKLIKPHDSQRGYFSYALYEAMEKNPNIFLITADLGYKMFDNILDDFSDRFINCGASEQAMLDIGVGLALMGKIPFCYSITPFLIYRPFETIRTYINHECINVKLVGSGRDSDYLHDGFSHDACDTRRILEQFQNIELIFPNEKNEVQTFVEYMVASNKPQFISLKR